MQERVNISRRFAEAAPAAEPRRRSGSVARWAVAAAGLLFIALVGPMSWDGPVEDSAVQASLEAPERAILQTLPSNQVQDQLLSDHLEALPLVEGADVRYQVSGETVDLAVVLHAGLDL